VIRVHTDRELTHRTIQTCPPGRAPSGLDEVLGLDDVRSVDLHRYVARVNLVAGALRSEAASSVEDALIGAWGPPADPPSQPRRRTFPAAASGPRVVAESLEMAGEHELLRRLLGTAGVVEAVVDDGAVAVRIGRLFAWADVEPAIRDAVDGR
jgi:hypothetical protein